MVDKRLSRRLFFPTFASPDKSVKPGLYHYMQEADGTFTRFHLRVDPDGRGMLLANATAAARLSPSGVVIVQGLLDEKSEDEILKRLKQLFRGASRERMMRDLERVAALLANLASPGDNYPIINFEDAEISPFEAELMAPFQADLELAHPEKLSPIFENLWTASIPHVIIWVNENPVHEDLIRIVERAEDLGMIAGIRGRASDLHDKDLLTELALAGLDHMNIPFASADSLVHDTIFGDGDHKLVIPLFITIQQIEVAPVAEIPLTATTTNQIDGTLEPLLSSGIYNVNFTAFASPDEFTEQQRDGALIASAMPQAADLVEEIANDSEVRFIWQPPVLRDPSLPLRQQIRRGARCSSDVSIRVESNGDVIPPRGPYRIAGNLLKQEWPEIWSDDTFAAYRNRVERPTHCDECPDLAICAVDCPRKMAGWSQGPGGASS